MRRMERERRESNSNDDCAFYGHAAEFPCGLIIGGGRVYEGKKKVR